MDKSILDDLLKCKEQALEHYLREDYLKNDNVINKKDNSEILLIDCGGFLGGSSYNCKYKGERLENILKFAEEQNNKEILDYFGMFFRKELTRLNEGPFQLVTKNIIHPKNSLFSKKDGEVTFEIKFSKVLSDVCDIIAKILDEHALDYRLVWYNDVECLDFNEEAHEPKDNITFKLPYDKKEEESLDDIYNHIAISFIPKNFND